MYIPIKISMKISSMEPTKKQPSKDKDKLNLRIKLYISKVYFFFIFFALNQYAHAMQNCEKQEEHASTMVLKGNLMVLNGTFGTYQQ
jgi:hypothetical protein